MHTEAREPRRTVHRNLSAPFVVAVSQSALIPVGRDCDTVSGAWATSPITVERTVPARTVESVRRFHVASSRASPDVVR